MSDTPKVELTPEQVAAKGREIEQAKWELPKKFQITKEMLAKSDEEQARLAAAAALPFGSMSPQDAERARSVVIAENLRNTLVDLRNQIGIAITTGEGNLEELREAVVAVRHQRAERLAIIGRYDLAAAEEPDPVFKAHYIEILEAVWRDDDEACSCEDVRGSGEHADITVPRHFIKEEIWSLKHSAVVPLVKCNVCGHLNAVPVIPRQLQRQRALRAKALQLVGQPDAQERVMSPEQAARTLTAQGHTAAKLLKSK